MEKNYILKKIEKFVKKDVGKIFNPFGSGDTTEKIIKIIKNV